MANDALQYQVHGDAIVQLGVGSANALVNSLISRDGVDVRFYQASRGIFTDIGGSELPAEYQDMGKYAIISVLAPIWVENYKRSAMTRMYQADGTTRQTDGLSAARGQLWGTHGLSFALAVIAGDFGRDPIYFPTCMIPPRPLGQKLGTVHSEFQFDFLAWEFMSGSSLTGVGKTLYAHAIP